MLSDWQQIVVVETIHKFTTDRKALVEAQTTSPAAGVYSEQQPMRVRCYIFIGLFLFGGIVQLVTVFIAKYSVGKLSCCLGARGGGRDNRQPWSTFAVCVHVFVHNRSPSPELHIRLPAGLVTGWVYRWTRLPTLRQRRRLYARTCIRTLGLKVSW